MHETRSTRNAVGVVLAILTGLTACSEFTSTPASAHEVVVQTAQTVYQIPPGAATLDVEATVTNAMDRALLMDGLGRDFFGLEKRVGDSWQPAYSAVHTLVAVAPLKLAPGASRALKFGLYVGGAPNTYPKFAYPIPGIYRAVFGFAVEHNGGFRIYSNPFTIRVSE